MCVCVCVCTNRPNLAFHMQLHNTSAISWGSLALRQLTSAPDPCEAAGAMAVRVVGARPDCPTQVDTTIAHENLPKLHLVRRVGTEGIARQTSRAPMHCKRASRWEAPWVGIVTSV